MLLRDYGCIVREISGLVLFSHCDFHIGFVQMKYGLAEGTAGSVDSHGGCSGGDLATMPPEDRHE
jgi:hypothetical protein